MKGFSDVGRVATPNKRHSVRFGGPQGYGISLFRNNRFWTTTFQNDATSISGRTANTLSKEKNDRSPSPAGRQFLGDDHNYYNGNDRSRIKTLRDDGLTTSGRTIKTCWDDVPLALGRTAKHFCTATAGFTLIELLVVVLIIGILAAVAVPQYEKVVEKTRAMEAVGLVRSVRQAQELYYMQNLRYASSLDALTLSFPLSLAKNFNWDAPDQLKNGRFAISRSAEKYFYVIVASGDFRGIHLPGKIYCAAQPSNKKAVEICSEIGSSEEDSDGSWRRFVIQ